MYADERGPVDVPGMLAGQTGSVLSVEENSGAFSALLEIPPGWSIEPNAEPADTELFVLEGEVALEGETVAAAGYAHLTRQAAGASLRSARGALVIALWNPASQALPPPSGALRTVRSQDMRWLAAEPGNHGVRCKSLRHPDVYLGSDGSSSGAFDGAPGGFVRLFHLAPGISDPEQHIHEECWEEIITLTGDVLQADEGLTARGSVLDHPKGFFHGPMASTRGALLLVHTDAPMGSPWPRRQYPMGQQVTDAYHSSAAWQSEPVHTPWPDCPERQMLESVEHMTWVRNHPDHTSWERSLA